MKRFITLTLASILVSSACGGSSESSSASASSTGSSASGSGGSSSSTTSSGSSTTSSSASSGSGGGAQGVWRVSGQALRDPEGRTVVLRGFNLAGSHKFKPYFGWQEADDYKRVRDDWGMNSL